MAKNSEIDPEDDRDYGANANALDQSFGFQDGISQPLMDGVDELDRNGPPNMNTDPSIIIVAKDTHHEGGVSRPKWMHDGSFVVFRKLEQDVEGFEKLTGRFEEFKCASKAHMGAKLVGRWPSGKALKAHRSPFFENLFLLTGSRFS